MTAVILGALAGGFSSPVRASESYLALAEQPFTYYDNITTPTPVAHVEGIHNTPNQTLREYNVTANRGIVNAWQRFSYCCVDGFYTWASFRFDDVVFSSPGGTGGTAQVSVNFIYEASVIDPTCGGGGTNAQTRVTLLLADALQEPWHSIGTWVAQGGSCGNAVSDGIFTGYNASWGINALLTTQTYAVPLDVPVQFRLRSEPSIGSANYFDQVIIETELRLPTGPTPVFNVPPGITVNSTQGNILNNFWLGVAQNCPGDIAPVGPGDAAVNIDDLLAVINAWGACANPPCAADVNNSGAIDIDDLLVVINGWGPCP